MPPKGYRKNADPSVTEIKNGDRVFYHPAKHDGFLGDGPLAAIITHYDGEFYNASVFNETGESYAKMGLTLTPFKPAPRADRKIGVLTRDGEEKAE